MNVLVENREAKERLERLATRIRSTPDWRKTKIEITATARATDPLELRNDGWWNNLHSASRLPTKGIFRCEGDRCEPMSQPKRNYAHDAATAADDVLKLHRNDDARQWWADLSVDVDSYDVANQAAWFLLQSHVNGSRIGSRVRDLNPKLLKPALQILASNTWRAEDDAEKEQGAIHYLDKEESGEEPWQKYISETSDARTWLRDLEVRHPPFELRETLGEAARRHFALPEQKHGRQSGPPHASGCSAPST